LGLQTQFSADSDLEETPHPQPSPARGEGVNRVGFIRILTRREVKPSWIRSLSPCGRGLGWGFYVQQNQSKMFFNWLFFRVFFAA